MMDSPLNLAHQQGRKADQMLKSGRFEDAIVCHNRAAELLLDAMQQTRYKTALDSLQLQHAHHLKQTNQLYDRQRRAQLLQIKQNKSQLCHQATQTNIQGPVIATSMDQTDQHSPRSSDHNITDSTTDGAEALSPLNEDSNYRTLTEHDSLIGLLIRRRQNLDGTNLSSLHSGVPIERVFNHSKPNTVANKAENSEISELEFANQDLRKHVQQLLKEVEELKKENKSLKGKVEVTERGGLPSLTIFSDVGESEIELLPDLPPLEMPQFDFDLLDQIKKDSDDADGEFDSFQAKSPE